MLDIKEEVAQALENRKPVLALESTIISHGMPYPQNMKVALELESLARESGVEPATICLMDGKIKIGLSERELEILATSQKVEKVSRRDFGRVLSSKQIGATTVAATMIAANFAGIQVFATGGIGGVHRGAESTFDISADLIELSQTPIIVVSAGAKAILDLPKTIEFLETFGVPVYGFQTKTFPAFYSSSSPFEVELVDSAVQIAKIFQLNQKLGFDQGILIANPIPERYEIPFDEMSKYIETAIRKAEELEIIGKKLTPFLLAELVSITNGKSLSTNIELVKSNVRLGCEIARNLSSYE